MKVQCNKCGFKDYIDKFPTITYYNEDPDYGSMKETTFKCPKCNVEGKKYFSLAEEIEYRVLTLWQPWASLWAPWNKEDRDKTGTNIMDS